MTRHRLPALPADAALEVRSARLEQVPMLRTHAEILFPLLSDPRLCGFTGDSPPTSLESLAELYAYRESRRSPEGTELWLNWLVRRLDGGEGVGCTQATVHATHAYVAWVIGVPWQGRGYASEAAAALVRCLEDLGVTEIRACVHPEHVASQRVARSAGLEREGEMEDGEDVWIRRRS